MLLHNVVIFCVLSDRYLPTSLCMAQGRMFVLCALVFTYLTVVDSHYLPARLCYVLCTYDVVCVLCRSYLVSPALLSSCMFVHSPIFKYMHRANPHIYS